MSVFLTWLASLIEGVIAPLIENWIKNMEISKQVSDLQSQNIALVKAIGDLQSAKTPQDKENAIKDIASADNSLSSK